MYARTTRTPTQEAQRWLAVCRADDVPLDAGACVQVADRRIAIFRYESRGRWFATDNRCPHRGAEVLASGRLGDAGGEPSVACPMHESTFALTDGRCVSGGERGLRTYPIAVGDGIVRIAIDLDVEP